MTILPSDDAFGVISFAPDSLSRTVSEASGSTVHLTVQRTGGLLGPSTVYWQVSGQGAQDVENTNGSVVLAVSRNSTQIAIRIKEDAVSFLFLDVLLYCLFNPLSPKSDQHQISPCNINALLNRVVMRITDMITQDEFAGYFIYVSPLLL